MMENMVADGQNREGKDRKASMPDWAFLPEGLEWMRQGHDSPAAFWAEMSRLAGMARERATVTGAKPDSFVSNEEWDAFWKAAGRPDAPNGYRLPDAWGREGVRPELAGAVNEALAGDREAFMQACHACNLTARQAEKLFDIYGGLLADALEEQAVESVPLQEVLAELWPKDVEKHLDAARRGARHVGIGEALDSQGLSANPLVLKMARALGEMLGEAGMPGGGGPGGLLPNGEAAREEMYRLISSPGYRNNDPEIMRKLEVLAGRVGAK